MSAFSCRSDDNVDAAANATTTTTVESFNNGVPGEVRFSSAVSGTAAALHMPIKREYQDEDSSCTDDSVSGMDWRSSSKLLKIGERAVDYSVTSPSYSSTDSSTANSSHATSAVRKSTGPRRNGKDEKLSPEEEERRRMRRERNKVAAAKCRQKRVDLTNQLLGETKLLEEEQSRLKETIKSYQHEKEELEFVLEAHRVHCGAALQQQQQPQATSLQQQPSAALHETKYNSSKSGEMLLGEYVKSDAAVSSAISRPDRISGLKAVPSSLGMASTGHAPVLSSPVFVLSLQSMINGHTGLTPLTELPSEMIPTSESFMAEEGKVVSSYGLSSDSKLTTL